MGDRSTVRIEAVGRSPEEAVAALPGLYSGTQWSSRGEPGRYEYRYSALGDDVMSFRTSRMSGTIRGDIPVSDDLVVQWLVSGSASIDPDGEDLRLLPGPPLLFPTERPFVFDYREYDQRLVHLSRSGVAAIAAERGAVGAIRFDHRAVATAAATALWFDTVGLVSRAVQRGPVGDLLWQDLARMTTAAFLELYPPISAATDPLVQPGTGRVRAAVEFVR